MADVWFSPTLMGVGEYGVGDSVIVADDMNEKHKGEIIAFGVDEQVLVQLDLDGSYFSTALEKLSRWSVPIA